MEVTTGQGALFMAVDSTICRKQMLFPLCNAEYVLPGQINGFNQRHC